VVAACRSQTLQRAWLERQPRQQRVTHADPPVHPSLGPWEVYSLIATGLRPLVRGRGAFSLGQGTTWESIIATSSHHLVTPSLAWCLESANPPEEVGSYFGAVLELNRRRNAMITDGIELASLALNDGGMVPLLMKGAAHLAGGLYPDPGARLLGDVDILVEESDIIRASHILADHNFVPKGPPQPSMRWHHHLPVQEHRDLGVGIEIHRYPGERRLSGLLDGPGYLSRSERLTFRGTAVRIPSVTDRLTQAITHSQISDDNYRTGIPHLRHLLDIAMLSSRHDEGIDWVELRDRFRRNGWEHVLTETMAASEALFGESGRCPLRLDPTAAAERIRKALERSPGEQRFRSILALLSDIPTALRHNPLRVTRALRPWSWPSLIRGRARGAPRSRRPGKQDNQD
jgi:hypothetical protein